MKPRFASNDNVALASLCTAVMDYVQERVDDAASSDEILTDLLFELHRTRIFALAEMSRQRKKEMQ